MNDEDATTEDFADGAYSLQIRQFMLGLNPYVVVQYDEIDGELTLTAGSGDVELFEKMLRSAAYRVKKERWAIRKQARKSKGAQA